MPVLLRRLAGYVQEHCHHDMALLLSSGFEAMSSNRSPTPLHQPKQLIIRHGTSGQPVASVKRLDNARLYEGRIKEANGDWMASCFTGDSRRLTFEGLTPGAVYAIQVRSLGGSTGQSDWSNPSSRMAM